MTIFYYSKKNFCVIFLLHLGPKARTSFLFYEGIFLLPNLLAICLSACFKLASPKTCQGQPINIRGSELKTLLKTREFGIKPVVK